MRKAISFMFRLLVGFAISFYCLYYVEQALELYTGLAGLDVNTRLLFSFVIGLIVAWARTI